MRQFATLLLLLVGAVVAEPTVEPLHKDLYWLPGNFVPGRQPDGNTVLIRGDTGWIVVDTGRHAEHSGRVLNFVQASKLPIAAIINTHWHLDHVSGNPMLKQAYPELRVYASAGIKTAMRGFLANYRKELQAQLLNPPNAEAAESWQREIARIDLGDALYPDTVVAESKTLSLAGRSIAINLSAHAVTEADLWLFDPETRSLIAGDLVTLPVPFLDTACPAHWRESLDGLADTRFRTLIPGHGDPMSRRQFKRYQRGFGRLLDCTASDAGATHCSDQWLHDLGDLIKPPEHSFTRQLLDYYINQILRGDPERIAKLCA